MRRLFIELARYTPSSCASRRTIVMQPSKSVSSASTRAPFASGWTSCAGVTRPRGRMTTAGMPAAAAYAASEAEVSPVDAHATARTRAPSPIICLTTDTSTVIPRSLNDPVCDSPHCFTHTSSTPIARPYRSTRSRLVAPSFIVTRFSSRSSGHTHSFLLHTPEPFGLAAWA